MKIEKKVFEQEHYIGLTADEGKVIIYQSMVEGRKAEGYTTFCVDVSIEDFICAEEVTREKFMERAEDFIMGFHYLD